MDLPPSPHQQQQQQPPFPPFPNPTTTIPSFAAHSLFPSAFSNPIPTTTTNFTALFEAQNHVTQTQSPISNLNLPTTNQSHPPYPEMIYSAIEALKEANGSSKFAISKYIERVYTNLPPTHSTLLTQYLKHLKNSGHLVMVKKSYMLSRSDSSATTLLPETINFTTYLPTTPSGSGRGRGRPPKTKPISQPNLNAHPFPPQPTTIQGFTQASAQPTTIQGFTQASAQPTNVQAYIQPTNAQPIAQQLSAEPMLVALGLVDDPNNESSAKRRPGRPRKEFEIGVAQNGSSIGKRGRGRPPGSKGKSMLPNESPGRPRKPKSLSTVSTVMTPKRGRGRPSKAEPKTMIIPQYATNVSMVGVEPNSNVVAVQQQSVLIPRGRPRKVVGSTVVSGKRRGRPAKVVGGVVKPQKRRGRPVGRPRKNVPKPLSEASHQLLAANGDLKRQLDYFQSKVKEAVGMLKPYVTHESAVNAIAAIQELEELATMDVRACNPINEAALTAQQPLQEAQQTEMDLPVQL